MYVWHYFRGKKYVIQMKERGVDSAGFGSQYHAQRAFFREIAVAVVLLAYGLIVDPYTGEGGVPCFWKMLFGVNCPGCGLSRAGAFILRGNFEAAARTNWLIIPLVMITTWRFMTQVFRYMCHFRIIPTLRRISPWQS